MAENIAIGEESAPTSILYQQTQEPSSPRKFQGSNTTRSSSSEESDDLLFNIETILGSDKHIRSLNNKDKASRLTPDFLNKASINSKMRTRLVKWMINLIADLEFKTDTLFLSVSILDHYLAAERETPQRLQLIGATSIYISSKLLETKLVSPEVYVYSASGVFTELELLAAQKKILLTLGFKTDFPDALRFLKLIRNYERLTQEEFTKAVEILAFVVQDEHKYYDYTGLELAQVTAKLIRSQPQLLNCELTSEAIENGFQYFKL